MAQPRHNKRPTPRVCETAEVFAALSDETRLKLLARLSGGSRCSIADLTRRSRLSRQAITKHLRTLEKAGIVRTEIAGRMCLCELEPEPLDQARNYLTMVSERWDAALSRLKAFVEKDS